MIEKDKFIVEHEFTKSEIATYLKDFHETTMLAMKYPSVPFYGIFLKLWQKIIEYNLPIMIII